MATHSSVLAWRIPGTGEPGGLPSMGSHRVEHDWSDLAAAAVQKTMRLFVIKTRYTQVLSHSEVTYLKEGRETFIVKFLCLRLVIAFTFSHKSKKSILSIFQIKCNKTTISISVLKAMTKGINTCPDLVSSLVQTHRSQGVGHRQPLRHKFPHSVTHTYPKCWSIQKIRVPPSCRCRIQVWQDIT